MQVINGTSYHDNTPQEVIAWLETSRATKQRIRIFYGAEGKNWNDEYATIGHVGRSTGIVKFPLLIHNAHSMGGGAILDDCIVRIDTRDSRGTVRTVYTAPNYRADNFLYSDVGNVYNETRNELYARCKSGDAARRLAGFMNGTRWAK